MFGQGDLPRNELRISVRGFKAAKANVYDQQGPNTTFSGWHPSGFGLSVTYSSMGSRKSGLLITAGLNRAPFSIKWDRQLTS